ncbi:MAG: hypothetical protein IKF96_03480, partial [Eggerthellaceae bacterium]|nr:hypothetical protein [Eggerthellaceae bacterium]
MVAMDAPCRHAMECVHYTRFISAYAAERRPRRSRRPRKGTAHRMNDPLFPFDGIIRAVAVSKVKPLGIDCAFHQAFRCEQERRNHGSHHPELG